MTPQEIQWWLNFGSFLGIAILAVPAWSLNFRKKKLRAIKAVMSDEPVTFKAKVGKIIEHKMDDDISSWRRIDEICLAVGYILLLGSSAMRLLT